MTRDAAREVRTRAGLFVLRGRGVLEVSGADRIRWAQGMLTADIAALASQGPGAGCYALLLTAQGRVVADFHVGLRDDALWLETERFAIPEAVARLEKYVIADDVHLLDRSPELGHLAVEGPRAPHILEALGGGFLAADAWAEVEIADAPAWLAHYALGGGRGFQVVTPAEQLEAVRVQLLERGAAAGLIEADPRLLELLRIEAGIPRLGRDLDESVLPDEAGLGDAISTTKGCYTGQEVVARMRSRGRISHRLVGLRAEGEHPLREGSEVRVADDRVGEVTSSAHSPEVGSIALAYLRTAHTDPGTLVDVGGTAARVVALPFVSSVREA